MTTPSTSVPAPAAVPLRTGLPTAGGGPIGQANAGTWSQLEQEEAFAAAGVQLAPAPPNQAPPAAASTSSGGS